MAVRALHGAGACVHLQTSRARLRPARGGRGTLLDSGPHCATNLCGIHPVINIE